MHPVLFKLGSLSFYTYGLFLGAGFAAGVAVSSRRAERRGISPDSLFWFFVLLLVGGIVGGRVGHIALNTWYYRDFMSIIDTREGGLSIHGVLVGGALTAVVYSRAKKLSFGKITDIVAPGLALGQAIGRIGCFFSGCCYGVKTSGTWGFLTRFAPGLRHPYQLYESIGDFVLFLVLLYLSGKLEAPGHLFSVYVLGYSGLRFVLEFWRDNEGYLAGLSYGQWVSLAGVLIGSTVYLWLTRRVVQSSSTPRDR